ncbi:MAG: EAL domain-containing protein [Gammaproteobacteria bacterium]
MEKIKYHWFLLFVLVFNALLSQADISVLLPFSADRIGLFSNLFFLMILPFLPPKKKQPFFALPGKKAKKDATLSDTTGRQIENDYYPADFLIGHLPSFFCIKDAKGRWLNANPTYLELFNIKGADFVGKTDLELSALPNANMAALRRSAGMDKTAWKTGKPISEFVHFATSLHELTFELVSTPIFDDDHNKLRLFINGYCIPKRFSIESKLYSSMFFSSHQAFLLFDAKMKIKELNPTFTRLTGITKNQAMGQSFSLFCKSSNNNDIDSAIANFFRYNSDHLWSGEVTCRRNPEESFPARLIVSPIIIEDSVEKTTYYFANIFDITQQKIDEQRILQLAHYDDLTGLPNRVMFCDRLSQFMSAAKRHNLHAVVMFLDLDRFKSVNDSLGHQAGDELLKEVASRLLEQTRKEDIVSRFSGDEFAVMILNEQSHEKAIYSVSIVAQKIIKELSEKFYIHRQDVFIGVSIGIAIYPEDAESVENILKNADIAMYEAKKQGRNNYQFFHKKFTAEAQDKRKMEVDLRKALQLGEFRLYFQPQYTAVGNEIWGAEVLVRWFQQQTKMVPPAYFIPVAEDTGLIIPLGTWIMETSCRQLKQWHENGRQIRQLAINISPRQFQDPNFLDIVEKTLEVTDLEPKYLEFEITESMLIGDIKKIELQLNRLKQIGIKIALDDFGTGYSSLSYLKNFPIDILKIDQSFIREMTLNSKEAQIAVAIIDMGHSLGQKIVAEGVENEYQFRFLKEKGCDIIQGYYFNPPLPLVDMHKLLDNDTKERLPN